MLKVFITIRFYVLMKILIDILTGGEVLVLAVNNPLKWSLTSTFCRIININSFEPIIDMIFHLSYREPFMVILNWMMLNENADRIQMQMQFAIPFPMETFFSDYFNK